MSKLSARLMHGAEDTGLAVRLVKPNGMLIARGQLHGSRSYVPQGFDPADPGALEDRQNELKLRL
jgi:hypothetical protein